MLISCNLLPEISKTDRLVNGKEGKTINLLLFKLREFKVGIGWIFKIVDKRFPDRSRVCRKEARFKKLDIEQRLELRKVHTTKFLQFNSEGNSVSLFLFRSREDKFAHKSPKSSGSVSSWF